VSGVVLAGGGLANSLIALRLRALRPEVPVVLVEQGETLGGNHTWSFHRDDLTPAQLAWLRPLVAHEWPEQWVRFPGFERRLATPYFSVSAARLHQVVSATLGRRARLGCEITALHPDGARLGSGEVLEGDLVIDGRGGGVERGLDLRWQKFVGLEVDLASPHGLDMPVLMDATVPQRDGYRFVYVLPLGPRRLLVEDTYYSDSAELRVAELRANLHAYVAARGWALSAVLREERGVLPIVLGGPEPGPLPGGVPRSGMRAGLFHHTTGYSLPDAVRLADAIAAAPVLQSDAIAALVTDIARRRWREQRFFRMLNRMMFEAAEPAERYRTLAHFYRLPEASIGRFYAGRLTLADQARLLSGRPPVPVGRALRAIARGLAPRHDGSLPREKRA
jgi:lycopene beta-cyclase